MVTEVRMRPRKGVIKVVVGRREGDSSWSWMLGGGQIPVSTPVGGKRVLRTWLGDTEGGLFGIGMEQVWMGRQPPRCLFQLELGGAW